jgi:CDGSH-type Zn-finger protein
MTTEDSKPTGIPCPVEAKGGRRLLWCACGLSRKQPFCDFSHKDTAVQPLAFVTTEDLTVVLCGCKRTRNPPYCDGSHALPMGAP